MDMRVNDQKKKTDDKNEDEEGIHVNCKMCSPLNVTGGNLSPKAVGKVNRVQLETLVRGGWKHARRMDPAGRGHGCNPGPSWNCNKQQNQEVRNIAEG